MSEQWFGSGATEGSCYCWGSRRIQCMLAEPQHAGEVCKGQGEHVSADWLIRLMGCWHLSPMAVETSEAD